MNQPSRDDYLQFLAWRSIDVENVCGECQGTGSKVYGSTATFFGGVGGQAMTAAVCDKCWGSGDATRPWSNILRAVREQRTMRSALEAADEVIDVAERVVDELAVHVPTTPQRITRYRTLREMTKKASLT